MQMKRSRTPENIFRFFKLVWNSIKNIFWIGCVLKRFVILTVILVVPIRSEAHSELDIRTILDLAEKNSPLLLSLNADLESLFYQRKQQGKTQNPFLTLDYGQRSAANESGAEYALQFEQPIYFPGRKELRQLLADNDSKIKEIQLAEANNSIRFNALRFTYRYLVSVGKRNHVKERLKRLSILESYIRARPFITPQAKTDLFIIQRKILALRKHFNDLELDSHKQYEAMNLYLMLESIPSFRIPFFSEGVKFNFNELQIKALSQNLILMAAKEEIEKAKTELNLANLEKYPDYSIVSQVGEDRSGVSNRFYDFGLKFRVPVWDQFQNKVSAAEVNVKSKQGIFHHQENLVKTAFKQAFLDYEQSKANLKLFNLSKLDEIEKDLIYADVEFKKGRILMLSYLELENQLHETHHAILDAQIAHLEALLNLLYITNEKEIIGTFQYAVQTFEYQLK
ncbi:TolC family protein [Leptospira alexanderi]|uniref:Outer membrane efflux protein n=1 Tax=Leptospira alexanderi serovar Manhao 3 str. L 60 TaxID=1049759 RepID=V6HTF5_9LEPT|nr:TolC family protein [Leptospira alexanderi]EQA60920.1 outer membrane efflux protein [Leptospira alexanderi serovar Manhao 3 str. L 60]